MMHSTFDPAAPRTMLPTERQVIWQPGAGWTYAHHAHLTYFAGRLIAIWSNGRRDEDAPGQRVMISSSADSTTWSPAVPLLDVLCDDAGCELVLTAGGLHHHAGHLVAYVGSYADGVVDPHLFALTSSDGVTWSAVRDLHLPVIPNHGPQRLQSGRLVIAGNISFPFTDDPYGLSGWTMSGIYPAGRAGIHDDPGIFWRVREWQDWPVALCEAAVLQTDDGTVHALLRSTGHGFMGRLWSTASRDNGATWSAPRESGFSDCDTKFHLGRLPDGRFYYVGCPDPREQHVRSTLVLSLSRDGAVFDQHAIIADEPWIMTTPGRSKHGDYGYPHTVIHDHHLYVIISRQKEAIEVIRIPLASLGAG